MEARSVSVVPPASKPRTSRAGKRFDPHRVRDANAHKTRSRRRTSTKPRVILGDPDPLARRAIRDALQDAGYVIPAEAGSGAELLELCRYYRPEVALLEIDLADMGTGEVIREIRRATPEVSVLMLSRDADPTSQMRALVAGASGFVTKSAELDEVTAALESVIAGGAVVPPQTTRALIERLRALPPGGYGMRPIQSPLTQREWEVLDLLAQEMDTGEIAETLVLTEETVYSHVKNVLRKLGVHSRAEAVAVGQRLRDPFSSAVS